MQEDEKKIKKSHRRGNDKCGIIRPSDVVRDIRNLKGRSKPLERALLFLSVDSFRSLLPYGK